MARTVAREAGPGDRGVSEFTGVAILVVMTVLITGSIGMHVLVVDETGDGPPDANFTFEYVDQSSSMLITHERGDSIRAGNLTVRSDDAEATWSDLASVNESAEVETGATVQISDRNAYGQRVRNVDDIRVVYVDDGGNETVLDEWDGDTF